MKSLIFLLATIGIANASTTISVSNLDTADTFDRAIVDNSGSIIAVGGGVVSVGFFETLSTVGDFGSATRTTLLDDFEQFGSSTSTGFQNSFNAEGFFSASFTDTIADVDSVFVDETLFTLIGNGDTLASSSEFLVFRHDGEILQPEVAGIGGNSGLVRPGDGTLLLGQDNGVIDVLGMQVGSFSTAIVSVPEPSSSVLLGLGGLAFVLRRRR